MSRPPDNVKASTNAPAALRALERADTVTEWDLPADWNTLQKMAALSDADVNGTESRGEVESALAEHYTDDE